MSEPEITAALEEVNRLDAEATPGPWQSAHPWSWDGLCTIIGDLDEDDGSPTYTTVCDVNEDPARWEANIYLINRYRTLAPLLASELERVRKVNAWQDIASAPRDGTLIEVYRFVDPWHVRGVAYWKDVRGISGWLARPFSDPPGVLGLANPTHWRALHPLPPQAKGE